MSKNEKVEQHIIKKTRKTNALRFWIECGVIPLYEFDLVLILRDLFGVFLLDSLSKVVSESLVCGLDEFLMEVSGKCVPYKCVNGDTSEES